MPKIKNIEFLRVILMFGIIMMHSYINRAWNIYRIFPDIDFFKLLRKCFACSNNGVEGFFIIAGFLLIINFNKNLSIKDFVIKKLIRFSPVIAFSTVFCFINHYFKINPFNIFKEILAIFLLNNAFIHIGGNANSPVWFVSALFTNLLLYLLIFKYVPRKYKYWLIGFLILLNYSLLEILRQGNFARPAYNIYGFLNIGNMRAIGGIGLGCIIASLYKNYYFKLKNASENIICKSIISLCELFLISFIIWWSYIPHHKYNNIIYVAAFSLLFILFIIKKGWISSFFEKDIWVELGKYQYSMYIMHLPLLKFVYNVVWKKVPNIVYQNPVLITIITYLLIILVSFLTYHLVEKPSTKFLTNKFFKKK